MDAAIPGRDPGLRRAVARRLAQVVLGLAVQAALLFLGAGTLSWGWGWGWVGATVAAMAGNALVLSPELIAERGRERPDQKRWDVVLTRLNVVPYLAVPLVAGLDERLLLSPRLATAWHVAGLVAYLAGYAFFGWAVASNRFFSAVVRIQADRGHAVESGGPYRWLRHPGYAGAIVFTLAAPLLLGSTWALAPAGLVALALVVRTVLEDRTLRAELAGYEAYARRVRWRLVPGLW